MNYGDTKAVAASRRKRADARFLVKIFMAASILTPAALNELGDLLRLSRNFLGEVYRSYTHGLTAEEIAEERGERDPRNVEDAMGGLLILFGRKALPKRGEGRQKALTAAEHWLNSNTALSPELETHLNTLLYLGKKTNGRKNYSPEPIQVRSIKNPGKNRGREAGVYVLTRQTYLNDYETGQVKQLLVKLGYSESVWERIDSAQVWDPEPLAILRVFLTPEPKKVETAFHIVLDTLHTNYRAGGGTEWFGVSLKLIDAIAETLNLRNCSEDKGPYPFTEG